MNRRNLLSAAAASMVLPGAVKAAVGGRSTFPDADLIALAERFIANERLIHAEPCDAEPGSSADDLQERRMRGLVSVQHTLTLRLGLLRAATVDGIAARARCLAVHNSDGAFSMEGPNTTTGRLLRYLLRDAGVLGGVAAEPTVSRDADLLETCAAFDVLEQAYLATDFGQPSRSPEGAAAEAERDRLHNAQRPLVDRMCQLRAVTREGQAARARSYALWDAEMMKPQDDIEGLFTQAIVRDLIE